MTLARTFPADHPFARPTANRTPADLVADVLAWNRSRFAGYTMKLVDGVEVPDDDPRPADEPDDDGSLADDEIIKIDGREWKIGDLKRIAAKEKRDGKAAGQRELLETLGVTDVDAAKSLVAAAKKAQQDQETEAQTRAREAKESKDAADREKRDAAAERRVTALERALVRRNVADDDLDDAAALLEKAVADGADADAIAEAADKLKERRPELFGGTTTPRTPRAGDLPGGRPGQRTAPKGQQFGAGGLARAERRFGKQREGA